ncbi:hypothetical protein JB92DRAFT_2831658 [Gautieria morchelliformis]|nr:hypothetical protein JB92DRAFT_2831658 [Gautieria morchelliformis]
MVTAQIGISVAQYNALGGKYPIYRQLDILAPAKPQFTFSLHRYSVQYRIPATAVARSSIGVPSSAGRPASAACRARAKEAQARHSRRRRRHPPHLPNQSSEQAADQRPPSVLVLSSPSEAGSPTNINLDASLAVSVAPSPPVPTLDTSAVTTATFIPPKPKPSSAQPWTARPYKINPPYRTPSARVRGWRGGFDARLVKIGHVELTTQGSASASGGTGSWVLYELVSGGGGVRRGFGGFGIVVWGLFG